MTEYSYPWLCTSVGDGGVYSLEAVENTTRILGNFDPKSSGPVYWTDDTPFPGFIGSSDGLLEPLGSPGFNLFEVESGVGLVQGWLYISDDITTFDFSPGSGNALATDIVGLRRDIPSQTVRMFRGKGDAGLKYTLEQTSTTWEIPLVEVTLSSTGGWSGTWVDVRKFVIHADSPNEFSTFVPIQIGANITDTTSINVTSQIPASMFSGVLTPEFIVPSGKDSIVSANFFARPDMPFANATVPFVSAGYTFDFRACWAVGSGGDIVYSLSFANDGGINGIGPLGQTFTANNQKTTQWFSEIALGFDPPYAYGYDDTCMQLSFKRFGTDVADTYALEIYLMGFEVKYNRIPSNTDLSLPFINE